MHSNGCTYKLFSFSVESKTIHPDYNPATFENDIAVVRLAERVTFKEHIIPVRKCEAFCLQQNKNAIMEKFHTYFIFGAHIEMSNHLSSNHLI